VSLYYDGTKIGDVTTGSDGSYSKTASIPTSGTYTLKASYAGEGFGLAPTFSIMGLQVSIPPELIEWLSEGLMYLGAALPLIIVGGVIAYNEVRR
jgi:hypothetical protein